MKRSILLLIVATFAVNAFAADEVFKGYIITNKGNTIVAKEFVKPNRQLSVKYEGQDVKIPIEDIKKVVFNKDNYYSIVTKRNGKEFKVKGSLWSLFQKRGKGYAGYVTYKFHDEINEKLSQNRIDTDSVKVLVFDDDFGHVRVDAETNQTFPHDYLFNPYTGKELKLKSIE